MYVRVNHPNTGMCINQISTFSKYWTYFLLLLQKLRMQWVQSVVVTLTRIREIFIRGIRTSKSKLQKRWKTLTKYIRAILYFNVCDTYVWITTNSTITIKLILNDWNVPLCVSSDIVNFNAGWDFCTNDAHCNHNTIFLPVETKQTS